MSSTPVTAATAPVTPASPLVTTAAPVTETAFYSNVQKCQVSRGSTDPAYHVCLAGQYAGVTPAKQPCTFSYGGTNGAFNLNINGQNIAVKSSVPSNVSMVFSYQPAISFLTVYNLYLTDTGSNTLKIDMAGDKKGTVVLEVSESRISTYTCIVN